MKALVLIDASAITSLAGNTSDLINAYGSNGISGLGNEAVTISDTLIDASLLNILDENTSGEIMPTVSTLVGDTSDLINAFGSTGIVGLGNEAVTISDTLIDASLLIF